MARTLDAPPRSSPRRSSGYDPRVAVKGTYSRVDGDVTTVGTDARVRASVYGSFAAKGAEMVTMLLLATLVPRALGPEAYGRFAVPLTIVTLGSLAMSLGGPTLLSRYVPAAPPHEQLGLARAIGARLARGRAVQLGAVVAVVALASLLVPDQVPAADTAIVVIALVLGVGASVALQVPLGLGRTGPWAIRYPIQNTVLIIAVLLLHDSTAVEGGLVAILLATLVTATFAAVVLWPIVRAPGVPVPIPDGALRFGAFHASGAALLQIVHRGGVVLVAVLAGASAEAGYTALATGLGLGRDLRRAPGVHRLAPAPGRSRHDQLWCRARAAPVGHRPACCPAPAHAAGSGRARPARAGGVRRGLQRRGRRVRTGAGHHRPGTAREPAGPGGRPSPPAGGRPGQWRGGRRRVRRRRPRRGARLGSSGWHPRGAGRHRGGTRRLPPAPPRRGERVAQRRVAARGRRPCSRWPGSREPERDEGGRGRADARSTGRSGTMPAGPRSAGPGAGARGGGRRWFAGSGRRGRGGGHRRRGLASCGPRATARPRRATEVPPRPRGAT